VGLKIEIQDAIKAAMKSGDQLTLSTLRLLMSSLHNEEIKQRRELTSEEIWKTISSLCRQRQSVLRGFLPQALSDEDLSTLIQSSIEEVGAKGVKDLGRVMKQIMPKVTGRVEGKRVSELAKEILSC